MTVYYECPSCKAHNAEHQKYCVDCGTWLQSTTFPAKRIDRGTKRTRKTGGSIIALLVIGFLVYLGWTNQGSLPAFSSDLRFDDIEIGEQFTISQLVVNPKTPSATADFTTHEELRDPVEVSISYYDGSDRRVGLSTALISKALAAGQTTTITFRFDEDNGVSSTRQIRVEITSLTPLMLLDRMANQ